MKKVNYLMEIFKLLINFIYLLLSGMAFLGYNLFFVKNNKIVLIILLGVGVFFFVMLLVALKNINNKILNEIEKKE